MLTLYCDWDVFVGDDGLRLGNTMIEEPEVKKCNWHPITVIKRGPDTQDKASRLENIISVTNIKPLSLQLILWLNVAMLNIVGSGVADHFTWWLNTALDFRLTLTA